jgi:hypothetical protein
MPILLDRIFLRTADELVLQLSAEAYRGSKVQLWLFEDLPKRVSVRAELGARGVHAQVFSAYKPLVNFFLDEIDSSGLTHARIEYPRHAACAENRFLLEAYPLTGLFPDVEIEFVAAPDVSEQSCYRLDLRYADRTEAHEVFAPNVMQADFLGKAVYAPSAWLKTGHCADGTPVAAEYQLACQEVMSAVMGHEWGKTEPYFKRLTIDMVLPGIERRLACGHEHMSTSEAMHEEIYFSLLEYFQHYSGRAAGSRGLQPGQIVPLVHLDNDGTPRIQISFEAAEHNKSQAPFQPPALDTRQIEGDAPDLAQVDRPLTIAQVERTLQALPGRHFAEASQQGRAVNVVYLAGDLPAVLISGAQHANETSGVVGSLRAAAQLKTRPGAHFALMPLENPDGYALHQALCVEHPAHMHHAARYTALGDDIEYREQAPWYEREARRRALAISGAQLHLNLHGYPAHEWIRPCTGYLPRGFEAWSIPKGFFLIARFKPDYKETALSLLEHLTRQLSADTRLMSYNTEQLRRYQRYVALPPFQVRHGIPYTASEAPGQGPGITLITEFPDETLCGPGFSFAHTVQMQTVLLASEWWWANAPKRQGGA